MKKDYLAKIIAKENSGLQTISACCENAQVKIGNIKYLKKNKIFLLFLERFNKEGKNKKLKINSICRFEFIDDVKSKNINQESEDLMLDFYTIDLIKKDKNFEIHLIFSNKGYIIISTELIEVTLEDQKL